MDVRAGYSQFCPVAMASEILCSRWTTLIIREMLCGTTRFNDLRRGVPRMSPALLSKRLKELQTAGIIIASPNDSGIVEYRLSPAGEDLREVIMGLGFWGQRWVESDVSLKNLDPSLLMWDMRRHLIPDPLAAATLHDTVSIPRTAEFAEELVAGRPERPGRSVRIRPGIRDRPARSVAR